MSARERLIDAIWECVVSGSSQGVLLASKRRSVDAAIVAIEAEAIEQERARLVAGVEGLPSRGRSFAGSDIVDRAAVLALIGSIATDGSECPLCGGVGRIFDITEDVNRALGEGKLLLSPLIRDTEGGTE